MGIIDTLLCWVGAFLGWLDSITGNYMIALFLFAFVVEIIMLPIGIKQQLNQRKQAMLRPKEMAIRKKYAGRDDRATQMKITEEIQAMYQKENFNQFGGCLPMLLQLPIILALYQVVINPLHYVLGVSTEAITAMQHYISTAVDAGGLGLETSKGTIEIISLLKSNGIAFFEGIVEYVDANAETLKISLSGAEVLEQFEAIMNHLPDFTIGGIDLAKIPTITEPSWLWLVPVLTFAVYFASMKLNRLFSYQPTTGNTEADKQAGCSNKMMDIAMPLMSVYITFIVPAAIGVYWIFKSLIGTLKQFIFSKTIKMPVFTEEDYKEAEREYGGKPSKEKRPKVNVTSTKGNPNSLFHMDDEDYVPPVEEEEESEDAPDDAVPGGSDTPISTAPLKDDPKRGKKKK